MIRYFAHSGSPDHHDDWQALEDHLQQTAARAETSGAAIGLAHSARLVGLLHDFGKFDPAFQRRLQGSIERVDHSTAGARLICDRAPSRFKPIAETLAYAILGHHAGLPDTTGSDASLARRLETFADPMDPAISAATEVDLGPVAQELLAKTRPRNSFDLSVAGRMIFSCLVDADFRDTEAFYDQLEGRQRDRDWPALRTILPDLRAAFDAHMAGFDVDSDLNRLRAEVLSHIRAGAALPPGLFTLSVPTGGGKTLASMGFALDHAARHGHRRIIYAIPYTSIIDQTATIFRGLFGDVVLEHHSAIDTEKPGQEGREKARLAMEEWVAPIVVTTNVQLFESLFAARPSRCRRLHNIAGSIIILDEAQCLPRKLLVPALRMLDTLAAHYGCTVVLCTATQPAFDSAHLKQGGLPLAGRELAPDPENLASRLRRARIVRGGAMDDAALIAALRKMSQAMVIVNSRKHALALYETATAEVLGGLIHLTTRQYPAHRRRVIANIRERLAAGQPCRLIATSLIEAGVDLDFPKGWRAEAGLDSIVQAAGRVNREGRRPVGDSTLTVFEAPDHPSPSEVKPLAAAMRSTAGRHDDLLTPEAIRDWFEQVYWRAGSVRMGQPMAEAFKVGASGTDFPYRTTAEAFRMIEDTMVPVIVAVEEAAQAEVARLGVPEIPSAPLARALQPFTVQVPARDRELLRLNGKGSFHAPHLRGEQFFVLTDITLYRDETGLWWEAADSLSEDQWLI
ncbi:MAG: CRISPR-associated helicase Cas3' [Proteobacteria bacterium]|nr:CRISPR-associated helicase Cas3' [Pseudomonadota bacterium]